MDINLHTMIIAGKWANNLWRQRSVELLLGTSFVMQLVLSLFAGCRWRGASSNKALRGFIWFSYVSAHYVATIALGNLSVYMSCSSDERQLLVFWAPFFLLHLGGPDNISAYQFEDNELSIRSVLELVAQVGGTLFIIYYYISGSLTLILAAWLMVFVGGIKYGERTWSLHRANMGSIARSLKLNKSRHRRRNPMFAADDDTAILMKAHSLFHICKRALVESLVEDELDKDEAAQTRKELLNLEWYQMFKVVEMELSLMYEFLYTKASVIYTWHGYSIRALSSLAVLGSFVLAELSINQHGGYRQSDVWITRVLLAATFTMEMVSLLRALGSSWTGFLLCTRMRPAWIHHQFICNNRWHHFRRAIASIGLLAKIVKKDHHVTDLHEEESGVINHHRRWSGIIGQLNLFQRVTCGPLEKNRESLWARGGSQEQINQRAKQAMYRKVRHKLIAVLGDELEATGAGMKADLRTKRGQKTLKDYGLYNELRDSLGTELQEGILTWHVGTNIFLNISDVASKPKNEEEANQVEAVRTLSDYMMHLLSERPHMLPGLVTRLLHEQTRRCLVELWNNPEHAAMKLDDNIAFRQEKLARILHDGDFKNWPITTYLVEGINLGKILIKEKEKEEEKKKGIVEMILEVWVDMLYHASYRCSKESHAKQLADGGELTTVVWLLAEHFNLFVPGTKKKARK